MSSRDRGGHATITRTSSAPCSGPRSVARMIAFGTWLTRLFFCPSAVSAVVALHRRHAGRLPDPTGLHDGARRRRRPGHRRRHRRCRVGLLPRPARACRSRCWRRRRLAFGATGRNLGFIWVHTRKVGPELDLVMNTRARLPELVEELGENCRSPDERRDRLLLRRATGGRDGASSWPSASRTASRCRCCRRPRRATSPRSCPPTVVGATYCELDAQVDPTLWVRAFAAAAARHGARIREGVRVERLLREGDRIVGRRDFRWPDPGRARSSSRPAAGRRSPCGSRLGIELPIHPMRLQIVQTEPMPHETRHPSSTAPTRSSSTRSSRTCRRSTTACSRATLEWRYDMLLLEGLPEGRRVVPPRLRDGLPGLRLGARTWPGVSAHQRAVDGRRPAPPRGAASPGPGRGVLPFTVDNLPIIDRAPGFDGLIVASGHVFGNGAGPTTGRLVADLVMRDRARHST